MTLLDRRSSTTAAPRRQHGEAPVTLTDADGAEALEVESWRDGGGYVIIIDRERRPRITGAVIPGGDTVLRRR